MKFKIWETCKQFSLSFISTAAPIWFFSLKFFANCNGNFKKVTPPVLWRQHTAHLRWLCGTHVKIGAKKAVLRSRGTEVVASLFVVYRFSPFIPKKSPQLNVFSHFQRITNRTTLPRTSWVHADWHFTAWLNTLKVWGRVAPRRTPCVVHLWPLITSLLVNRS